MLCALIMAGGCGSRFWPQSTVDKPKQFLKLINDKTMLQLTYDRINKLIPTEKIFIAVNQKYMGLVKEQLPFIKEENIISEPCSKNTAPCILLSSLYIKNMLGETNIVCASSDSYIKKENLFIEKIKCASEFLNNNKDAIVTLGITPTRPETGYGYIKYKQKKYIPYKVIKFVEKPNLDKAKEYISSNEYLWNAGIFVFNNISMINEFKNNVEDEYNLLKDLPFVNDKKYNVYLNQNYVKCQKISIDYAVIEKSANVYTIPSDIGWDDIGTWVSLIRYLKEDKFGNVIKGHVKLINSCNNIVYGNGKKIILLNVENLCCIDSDDVIIIGRREDLNQVHTLNDD